VDAYDISDPVDILPEFRSFDDEVANTAKWSVRRDILTKLKTLAGASKTALGHLWQQRCTNMRVALRPAIINICTDQLHSPPRRYA
jgi:hypothetical protein